MDQKQFDDLINQIKGSVITTNPDVRSKIDKVIPLPIGTKTITGILGALLSYGALKVAPGGDWTQVLDFVVASFMSLGGAGLVSKYQRQINVAEETLKVMVALLDKVQKAE